MKKPSNMHARVQEAAEKRKNRDLIEKMSKDGDLDPKSFIEVTRGMKMPEEPYYDLMEAFYQETTLNLSGLVYNFGIQVQKAVQQDFTQTLKHNARLNTLISSVHLDYQSLQTRFNQLYERHKGKTGKCESSDAVLEVFNIQAEYQDAVMVFNTNVPPALTEAVEIIEMHQRQNPNPLQTDTQESATQEEKIDPQLLDPTVTSDVEFKEVK